MDLKAIQRALSEAGVDGWLFFDHHHHDPIAYRILGLDPAGMTTRRWFYFVPASGEPVRLCHKVEPRKLDPLPGRKELYLAYTELHERLGAILPNGGRVAMQYSPMNHIPVVSTVDAGTIELVRSLGVEVVTSADLVQRFEAVTGADGFASHSAAGAKVQAIKDEVFERMDRALRTGQDVTEYEIREHILARFAAEGLTSDGAIPIVGFNEHPADPHFEPTAEKAKTLRRGDTILVDLWARRSEPAGVYYDITWCGFAGEDPPAKYLEIWNTVVAARDAGLAFVRSKFADGVEVRGCEVDDVVRRVVRDAGWGERFLHRTGHSIGVDDVHGYGANLDNLETRDERLLLPGTCFSIEPGIYLDGEMAVRSEIDVFLTPAGEVEVVGPVQKDLILVGGGA